MSVIHPFQRRIYIRRRPVFLVAVCRSAVNAREGFFLGFQYPVEIPGVNNAYLLKAAMNAARRHRGLPEIDAFDFLGLVREKMKLMKMDEACL